MLPPIALCSVENPMSRAAASICSCCARGGVDKVQMLGSLRYSTEGRAVGARVSGLRRTLFVRRLCHIPVLGAVLSVFQLPALLRDFRQSVAQSHFAQRRIVDAFDALAATTESALQQHGSALAAQRTFAAQLPPVLEQMHAAIATRASTQSVLTVAQHLRQIQALRGDVFALRVGLEGIARRTTTWVGEMEARLSGVNLGAVEASIRAIEAALPHKADFIRVHAVERAMSALRESAAELARVEALERVVSEKADATGLGALARRVSDLGDSKVDSARLEALARQLAQLQESKVDRTKVADQLTHAADDSAREMYAQRREVLHAHARIDRLADQLDGQPLRVAADAGSGLVPSAHSDALDAFYVSFEDHFRGSRELITQRAEAYVPVVRAALERTRGGTVLDVGCGRGEWLQLLQRENIEARGIDLNTVMVAECRALGVAVEQADVLTHLRGLPESSLAVVTGMHIVEHIPFAALVALFDESLRVLKPGGVVIFETPNPENLMVGACNFYMDPTHRNPLPPALLEYVAGARGFAHVEIQRLSAYRIDDTVPAADSSQPGVEAVEWLLQAARQTLYSAPDYAVVARKLGGADRVDR